MYEYACEIVRVIDGDSIIVDVDLGFNMCARNISVRLNGIDTPESRTRDLEEKVYGILAKERVVDIILGWEESGFPIILQSYGIDKYGRCLGDLFCDASEHSLADHLINERLAVEYHGQSKEDIQEAHLANRKLLKENQIV